MMIEFEIMGEPVAKGRARSFVRNGHVSHYTPDKTARYENLVKMCAKQAMQDAPPIDTACRLTVKAYFGVPKSWSKKKQQQALDGALAHAKRPDLDNVIKAVKDGMNCVVWRDDCQVVEISACKRYSDTPRVWVCVEHLI